MQRLCHTYRRMGQSVLASCLHTEGSTLTSLVSSFPANWQRLLGLVITIQVLQDLDFHAGSPASANTLLYGLLIGSCWPQLNLAQQLEALVVEFRGLWYDAI